MADKTDARETVVLQNIKSEIVNAIQRIRTQKKKRPTTESIYNHIREGDSDLEIEEYKEAFENLLENGKIKLIGEGSGSESVFVLKDNDNTDNLENHPEETEETRRHSTNSSYTTDMYEKYKEIYSELQNFKEFTIGELRNLKERPIRSGFDSYRNSVDNNYTENLLSEINFLRDEIKNKNAIINILLEHHNFNAYKNTSNDDDDKYRNSQRDDFIKPKKFF